MEKIETDGAFFNVEQTLSCGQAFRWEREENGFLVHAEDKTCFAYNEGGGAYVCCEDGQAEYFYRYFDAMKNNIEIFFWVGEEDTEDIIPVLERDWEASHSVLIGVQNYDIRKEHPDADPVLCIYFASILSDIGRFFECRGKEA